jgi:hypothetical protein
MRILLQIVESNSSCTHAELHLNGSLCGCLTMSTDEAKELLAVLCIGCKADDVFELSGQIYPGIVPPLEFPPMRPNHDREDFDVRR